MEYLFFLMLIIFICFIAGSFILYQKLINFSNKLDVVETNIFKLSYEHVDDGIEESETNIINPEVLERRSSFDKRISELQKEIALAKKDLKHSYDFVTPAELFHPGIYNLPPEPIYPTPNKEEYAK